MDTPTTAPRPHPAALRHRDAVTGTLIGLIAGAPSMPAACLLALAGMVLGGLLDRLRADPGARAPTGALGRPGHRVIAACGDRDTFLCGLFALLGHLARLDGPVSEQGIRLADGLAEELGLSPAERRRSRERFRAGKADPALVRRELGACAERFRRAYWVRRWLLERAMAYALGIGRDTARVKAALRQAALHLGFRASAPVRWRPGVEGHRARLTAVQGRAVPGALARAFRLLGVPPDASEEAVRVAYRRALNAHHPDKLQGRGASRAAVAQAQAHTRAVRSAWETIRAAGGARGS